ncbi:hypothetical protein ACFFUP_10185 [Vibrio ostreicida]|nr:hypothetical protein [Vibrio ostreicida]NPD09194.1 hypothetical protein [Vibrio ostreicida]
MIKELSQGGPLATLLLKMKDQISNKSAADHAYRDLYPILEELLAKGYAFESQEMQSAVSLLSKMPAWGARREHFKKMYLKSEAGLRKLPRDPRNIPSGLWH